MKHLLIYLMAAATAAAQLPLETEANANAVREVLDVVRNDEIFGPVEALPQRVMIRDEFLGGAYVNLATAGQSGCNPGPGVMTAVNVIGAIQVGKGNLQMHRQPIRGGSAASSRTSVRFDRDASTPGVLAAEGLTYIARFVPGVSTSRYTPDILGFSLSSTEISGNSAGSFFCNLDPSTNAFQLVNVLRTPAVNGGSYSDGVLDAGELVSVAVKYETLGASTRISYWVQGGALARSLGCDNYSDNWLEMFVEEAGTEITAGTTVYPFVAKSCGTGMIDVREVAILSEWTPSPRHGLLDVIRDGKLGMHAPAIVRDPVSGLFIAAWQNGSTHENIDLVLNGSVRLADGTWTERVTLVPAQVAARATFMGSLFVADGIVRMTYIIEPVTEVHGGGEIYWRTVSTDAAGSITLGAETKLTIPGTTNHCAGNHLQLPSGRIIIPHNEPSTQMKIAYSDDGGTTWDVSYVVDQATDGALAGAGGAGGGGGSQGTIEGSVFLESDGALGYVFRTNGIYNLNYARSTDEGETWTAPVQIPGIRTRQRPMAKNLSDGSIWLMGSDNNTQRRNIRLWRMGDNGAVLGSIPMADTAMVGTSGSTYWQYPNFEQDGDDLIWLASYQGVPAFGTSMEYHTEPWLGAKDPRLEWTDQIGAPRSQITQTGGKLYHAGPTGRNAWVGFATAASLITLDCNLSDTFIVEAQGNFTLAPPTNPMPFQRITVAIQQDGTGSRTVTLNAAIKTGPHTVTLSTGANLIDYMEIIYNQYEGEWHVLDFFKGY